MRVHVWCPSDFAEGSKVGVLEDGRKPQVPVKTLGGSFPHNTIIRIIVHAGYIGVPFLRKVPCVSYTGRPREAIHHVEKRQGSERS